MLKLKRVEIQGFKSFFDKTEMRFHGSGIAAVVGPNGCGKSNLSDAISWVLGEQSAKSLRGARMEDVIFAGTRERKPLGMASVTMTLADPRGPVEPQELSKQEPAKHDLPRRPTEVTITRRLFRSGESEYLINGRAARLRDIQDLFMGTGLGPESYAIIEQGRIGQILSNRPQDRRAVLEEAAGITKFKTRKRLAEAKLEGAKQNLTRVFDILEEVGRQVNSLKRQAAKTKRYAEIKSELTGRLRQALGGRFRIVEREAAKTAIELSQAGTELQALTARVAEREQEHERLQAACFATEAELTDKRKALSELRLEHERSRGRLDFQAKQIAAIEQRQVQDAGEARDLEARGADQTRELETHAAALARLESEAESARRKLDEKTAEREQLQQALRERGGKLEAGRQQVLRLLGEAAALKNQLAKLDEYLSAVGRDTERLGRDEESAAGDLVRLEAQGREIAAKLEARQAELAALSNQRSAAELELNTRKTKLGEARRQIETLRAEASRLKARRDSLAEVISHRSYTTESVKRIFTAIERGQFAVKPAGVLADFLEADPAYEKAVEEFLHEELEQVVVKDWNDAERGIGALRTDLDGRATFLVVPGLAAPGAEHPEPAEAAQAAVNRINDPGLIGKLTDYLRFTAALAHAPEDLVPRLSRCYLANDRAAAQTLAVRHPEAYFLLPDGISYHGHALSGGKKRGSGPLALKRELREVNAQAQAKQTAVNAAAASLEELEREIARFTEELERLRSLYQGHEREALALDHEQRKLKEEHHRAGSRLALARQELARLLKESERARAERHTQEQAAGAKETARVAEEQSLERSRADFDSLQSAAARLNEEHSGLRAALAALEERRRAEKTAQLRVEAQVAEIAKRRESLTRETERLAAERARLLADNGMLAQRTGELTGQITSLNETAERLAALGAASRTELSAAEEALKQLRLEAGTAQDKRSRIELELVKRQAELKYLDETSRKELGISAEEVAAGQETVLDESGLAEAERKCEELRARIEALGPVNPDALREFEEAQQRQDFLNAQRQDLLDSIRDIEKAIQEVETESRKRFLEAFQAINSHFREMFQTLFGGGTGEMRLTDEDNAAESGIDIVASPPGKRLQNVLLLSGGEKSLTAMALLMAIFQYQPSPFCILDEVDAPLDEPNIERLTRLLEEMSDQTQFIVITHAKRTMEAAQSLYGVTMQEPGVSKLVSVRFQAVEAQKVAARRELEAVGSN